MKKLVLAALALAVVGLSSCDKEEVKLRPISVAFQSAETGIEDDTQSEDIVLTLTRKSDVPIVATIGLSVTGVIYGEHFTIDPAPSGNQLSITIPAGQTTASFSIDKEVDDIDLLPGNKTIVFSLNSLSVDGVKIGSRSATTVTFGEIISESSDMTLQGATGTEGEAIYTNSVYVDFSTNKQTPVDRKSWNLGFWCGDEFRVVLNSAYATAASATEKTDIDDVDQDDANDHAFDLNSAGAMGMGSVAKSPAMDDPDGSLTGTTFAEVSATDSENYVYFVSSGADRADRTKWYKVKVSRNGSDGYTVKFGLAGDTGAAIKTVNITKNEDYNFIFLSLETGNTVSAEPKASKWDIKWSYDYGAFLTGGSTFYIVGQDYISINNLGGTQVATVMTADVTYSAFAKANLGSLDLESGRGAIGSGWRATGGGGPGMPGGGAAQVFQDRFYVVKDPAGNYYKFRITKAGIGDTGTRGKPELEYALVK